MKNFIPHFPRKATLIGMLILSAISHSAFAETSTYSIRVDGLACQYCAYGIEKKLNAVKGVKFIDMNLDTGVVNLEATDIKLDDEQLKQLFKDSGFTYRSKKVIVK